MKDSEIYDLLAEVCKVLVRVASDVPSRDPDIAMCDSYYDARDLVDFLLSKKLDAIAKEKRNETA